MASIFSKNGILAGRIDHYCLICAEQFSNEEETLAHIADSQHKENLQSCGYFEKYKEDLIRKAKGLYFCEACSQIFPTATKVELHIDEPTHIKEKNKISPWLKRVENDIIAFNKFLISDDAWNGCIEDTCILCNTEFDDDISSHKATRSHILNLFKSEVMSDNVETAVYRTIDARSNQCLTCNTIIGNDPTSHFKTAEHKEAYRMYEEHPSSETKRTTGSKIQNANTANLVKIDNKKADDKGVNKCVNGDVTGVANKDVGKNINKDVKKDSNKDLKKDSNKDLKKDKDFDKVKDNSKQSVNSSKKESAAELDKILCKNLGAKNYVTSKDGENWCILCEWLLEDSPEAHIHTKHHQNLLKIHKERIMERDSNNKRNVTNKEEKSNLYECVDKYQKSNINIDLINETAVCKKCSKNIDFNTDAIDKHIEEHKKAPNKKSQETAKPLLSGIKSDGTEKTTLFTKPVLLTTGKEKRRPRNVSSAVKVEDYAKQHGLSHNRADNSFYCKLCSRRLPTTLSDLEKHVASRIHTENSTKQSTTAEATKARVKVPLLEIIKSTEFFDSQTDQGPIFIINNKYWLKMFDFLLIAKNQGKVFCHGCNIDLIPENILEHIMLDNHRKMVEECLLVTSLENEFIREIKLEVYHCGYCNDVAEDWDDILEHIATDCHKKEKEKAEENLRNHDPARLQWIDMRDVMGAFRDFMLRNRFDRFDRFDPFDRFDRFDRFG